MKWENEDVFEQSVRCKAFKGFDSGLRPSELDEMGAKQETLYRYFQQWKKIRKNDSLLQKTIPAMRRKIQHRRVDIGPNWLFDRLMRNNRDVREAELFTTLYRKVPSLRREVNRAIREERNRGQELWKDSAWPTILTPREIDRWFRLAERAKATGLFRDTILFLESRLPRPKSTRRQRLIVHGNAK